MRPQFACIHRGLHRSGDGSWEISNPYPAATASRWTICRVDLETGIRTRVATSDTFREARAWVSQRYDTTAAGEALRWGHARQQAPTDPAKETT